MRFFRSKWRKLKRFLFYRKKPARVSTPDSVEDQINQRNEGAHRKYKRVALIKGHTDDKSGTSSYPVVMPSDFHDRPEKKLKRREYDINGFVLTKAKNIIDLVSTSMAVMLFLRDGIGIKGVGRALEKWQPDLVIAGHKNSVGHNSDVEGREILMQRKYKGTFAEQEAYRMLRLLKHFIGPSPLRGEDRKGIRWVEKRDRGDYNLDVYDDSGCKVVMLLEEEFIGKRTKTAATLMENDGLENNSKAIAHFCLGYDIVNGELVS